MAAGPFVVRNRTRGAIVASKVELADTPRARRTGLLKRDRLNAGEGLWIYPTQAIHTFGMRFPIDVAFIDRRMRVKRIYHQLAPFRLTSTPQDVAARLELGGVYESYKLYDNAFERSREALQLSLSDGATAEQAVAGLSRSARASRRPADAIAPVETLVWQRPSAACWNELGLLYQAAGDLGKAEIAFAQAATLNPESDRAYK